MTKLLISLASVTYRIIKINLTGTVFDLDLDLDFN